MYLIVFGKGAVDPYEPKRDLVISLFANLKFLDGKIIPEWQEPFMVLDKLGVLTKQKSQTKSEISDYNAVWLAPQYFVGTQNPETIKRDMAIKRDMERISSYIQINESIMNRIIYSFKQRLYLNSLKKSHA